ncbi:type IV pilus assembly protein PilM [Alkalibacillus filiformis]|uniref:Type IV pilus assembly protein PilM n=1 Tax=Alkalibacillus filiformis TaxID=200990 RepID=A0ABU0DU56_9BACI|nr:pilus assembly protein PilM [Alkalibacillus filiformis]MDQ0351998.1 type IV pilus assembly protein PilM [Alkalibacillus filiformis]
MSNKKVVNLEIKDYVIRFTESKKGSSSISRLGEHFLPTGIVKNGVIEDFDQFVKILKTVVKKWRLKRKNVRFIMPDSLVFIRRETVPLNVDKDEVKKHIYFNIGDTIHLPFDSSVVEVVYIRELEEHHEVSMISTDQAVANQYDEALDLASVTVEAIDISPLCYYRLLHSNELVKQDDHLLLIQYQVDRVTFSAFVQNTPIFLQEFDLESSEFVTEQLGPTLSKEDFNKQTVMEELDDMNIEVERVERFYQFMMNDYEQKFTTIAVVGDHPYLEEIVSTMSEGYETPIVQLTDNNVKGPKEMGVEFKFHNVYGLALKGGR